MEAFPVRTSVCSSMKCTPAELIIVEQKMPAIPLQIPVL